MDLPPELVGETDSESEIPIHSEKDDSSGTDSDTCSASLSSSFERKEEEWRRIRIRHSKAKRDLHREKKKAKVSTKEDQQKAKQFADQILQKEYAGPPGAVELFCGSAGLTYELEKIGFHAIGVDYVMNKDKPRGRYLCLDLSMPEGQEAFRQLVKENRVVYVHIAPPCGTASRAREVRRFDKQGRPEQNDPMPLRSDERPDG